MCTRTILLINSESSIRELVQVCLSHFGGWQILAVGSQTEGLQSAAQNQPDAIVLDFSLSDKQYITFLQDLRAQPETQTIPVIVLTAGAKWLNHKRLQQFQVAGAIDYAPDFNQLSSQIAKLLNWAESPEIKDNI